MLSAYNVNTHNWIDVSWCDATTKLNKIVTTASSHLGREMRKDDDEEKQGREKRLQITTITTTSPLNKNIFRSRSSFLSTSFTKQLLYRPASKRIPRSSKTFVIDSSSHSSLIRLWYVCGLCGWHGQGLTFLTKGEKKKTAANSLV